MSSTLASIILTLLNFATMGGLIYGLVRAVLWVWEHAPY